MSVNFGNSNFGNWPSGNTFRNSSSNSMFMNLIMMALFSGIFQRPGQNQAENWYEGSWNNAAEKAGESLSVFDSNNDGTLTVDETIENLVADGMKDLTAQALVGATDANGDGNISCFEDMALSLVQDTNRDGKISNRELKRFMNSLKKDPDGISEDIKREFSETVYNINGTPMTLEQWRESVVA